MDDNVCSAERLDSSIFNISFLVLLCSQVCSLAMSHCNFLSPNATTPDFVISSLFR